MTAQATRIRRMDSGLCYGCGEGPPAPGKLQCDACLSRQSQMWRSWREKTAAIERDQAGIRAECLGVASMESGPPGGDDAAEAEPGADLLAIGGNVIRVADARGRPVLAVLPWDDYRKLLRRTIPAGHRARGRPRKEAEVSPRNGPTGGPPGRPPLADAHVLRELIRDNPDSPDARIADLFLERTGVRTNRSTVCRYRREMNRPRPGREAVPPGPGRKAGLVVNGFDLGEYDAIILEAARRAGAPPASAGESEEYADGLVGLYEAAEDFGPSDGDSFPRYAAERIRRAIYRGKEERKVKVKGKSGRVLNFSEIGGEDFDIADLIDESGRVG